MLLPSADPTNNAMLGGCMHLKATDSSQAGPVSYKLIRSIWNFLIEIRAKFAGHL